MPTKINKKTGCIIYPNVNLGKNYRFDYGVILGFSEGLDFARTTIGDNSIIRPFTVIYAGVHIGNNFQTGPHVLVRENNTLGNDVAIWHNSTLSPGNSIGDGCRIHTGCFLELVTLGKRVFIGPNVVFTDDPHPLNPSPRIHFGGAIVEDEAVIGANVTILPHVRIGKRAMVGAGSVVTKDVPPNEVWVGNPAKFLRHVKDITCEFGSKPHYPYREAWVIK